MKGSATLALHFSIIESGGAAIDRQRLPLLNKGSLWVLSHQYVFRWLPE